MFTIRYMKCGRKWRVVAHEGGSYMRGSTVIRYMTFQLYSRVHAFLYSALSM